MTSLLPLPLGGRIARGAVSSLVTVATNKEQRGVTASPWKGLPVHWSPAPAASTVALENKGHQGELREAATLCVCVCVGGALWPDPASPFRPAHDLSTNAYFLCLLSLPLSPLFQGQVSQSRCSQRDFGRNGGTILGGKDPGSRVRPGFKPEPCHSLAT